MKLAAVGIVVALALSSAATHAQTKPGEPNIPATWAGFLASKFPADQRNVAAIQKMQWWKACAAWGREARSNKNPRLKFALLHFLEDDHSINGVDLGGAASGKPKIGMSLCGVVAAMGMPDAINQTQTATRHRAQLVYRAKRTYIYTEGNDANGLVTSIQF